MAIGQPTTRTANISVDGGKIDTATITAGGSKAIVAVFPLALPNECNILRVDLPSNGATAVVTVDSRGVAGTDNLTLTMTVSEIATA